MKTSSKIRRNLICGLMNTAIPGSVASVLGEYSFMDGVSLEIFGYEFLNPVVV